jgi:hypothetical protein
MISKRLFNIATPLRPFASFSFGKRQLLSDKLAFSSSFEKQINNFDAQNVQNGDASKSEIKVNEKDSLSISSIASNIVKLKLWPGKFSHILLSENNNKKP